MRIERGRAWGEAFDVATADLELEGTGLRVSRIEMSKGPGRMFGAARIGWDGTYVFNADGQGVPVETLDNFRVETAPLSGRLTFKVSGAGVFEAPTYTFEASIDDLFVGDEGIGAVSGRVAIDDDVMTIERLAAASSRLQVLGTGTIVFNESYTSDLRFRFQETAIDPYLKFVLTDDVSPYTRVVVGGSLSVVGPLADPVSLTVDTTIDDATLTLYDYDLRNDGPLRMRLADGRLDLPAFALAGNSTNLALSGGADLRARSFDLSAAGDANMAILQLFFKGITAAGAARLNASLAGSFDAPRLTGDAVISDGRFRPFGSPHSLEAINGRIQFASNAINLDGVTGRVGSGDVAFGGSIALDGYQLADYNLTATGRSMRLRYPEGFNSTVDMRLFLTGPQDAPVLSGTIDVLRVAFSGASQSSGGLLGLATAGTAGVPAVAPAPSVSSGTPLALDIQVTAPRMPFIDTNTARIEASADLQVRGTFDVPSIEGAIEIAGGEVLNFNGNRYIVREGSIDFNPGQAEPVFDLAAETRPRVSGQTFTVNVGISGTVDRINFTTSSDPWLPESDVISLLFGGTPALGTAEERSLRSSQELQQQMLQTAGAALLASPITSRVGAAVERTGAFDTVQITPVLTNEEAFQQLSPTARVTFGKRISPRVFLTYSRTIGGPRGGDHPARIRSERPDVMGAVAQRRSDLRAGLPDPVRLLMHTWFRSLGMVTGLVLAAAAGVHAQEPDGPIGRTVVAIRFEVEGHPDDAPSLAGLSAVRVGEPLRREDVRSSIARLDGLGLYDGVSATAAFVPGGVEVVFRLDPRHPVTALEIEGDTGIAAGALRRMLQQRYGGVPATARPSAVEATATQMLVDEGYLSARVDSRTDLTHQPDVATLVLDVRAGPLSVIRSVSVQGASPRSDADIIRSSHAAVGMPYRRREIATALTGIEDDLRSRGYYEAQLSLEATPAADGVDLVIAVRTGPRVELRIVPSNVLPGSVDDLVPIRRLGSADQDLLEDSRDRIERALRAEGTGKHRHPSREASSRMANCSSLRSRSIAVCATTWSVWNCRRVWRCRRRNSAS